MLARPFSIDRHVHKQADCLGYKIVFTFHAPRHGGLIARRLECELRGVGGSKGFKNSSLILIKSLGRLSVIVMLPSPTSLFPAHLKMAPIPADRPSKVTLAAGSSFADGDQASQLWKSFTCANTWPDGLFPSL